MDSVLVLWLNGSHSVKLWTLHVPCVFSAAVLPKLHVMGVCCEEKLVILWSTCIVTFCAADCLTDKCFYCQCNQDERIYICDAMRTSTHENNFYALCVCVCVRAHFYLSH